MNIDGALDTAKGGPDDNSAQANHIVAHTLTAEGFDASEDGTGRGTPLTVAHSLCARTQKGGDPTTDTYVPISFATQQTPKGWGDDAVPSLQVPSPTGGGQPHAVAEHQGVRRLTPTECERLQGFPDGWTLMPDQLAANEPNPKPDSHRYAQMGNAVSVPVAFWIGSRIVQESNNGN